MTQEELDRLESLANAATGGSWEVGDPYDGRTALLVAVYGMGMEVADTQTEKDAAFIAAARSAVPSLIAEVRRLGRILDALREPSEVVMIAVQDAVYDQVGAPCHYREATVIVRAAVVAAEQEAQP